MNRDQALLGVVQPLMQCDVHSHTEWQGSFICSFLLSRSSSLPSPAHCLMCLCLGLAHCCSLVNWDSMYPEKVRSHRCSAFKVIHVLVPTAVTHPALLVSLLHFTLCPIRHMWVCGIYLAPLTVLKSMFAYKWCCLGHWAQWTLT